MNSLPEFLISADRNVVGPAAALKKHLQIFISEVQE
jgi:hypothetical protein